MKKNCMKGLFSFVIAGMMTLSMFSVAGTKTVVNAEDANQWTVSKSKTTASETLDRNYETQITLALPAKEEQLTSDVVFVMDLSSCKEEAVKTVNELFTSITSQIVENKASLKVGLVVFKGNAAVAYGLNDFAKAKTEMPTAITNTKAYTDAKVDLETANLPQQIAADTAVVNNTVVSDEVKSMQIHRSNMPAGLERAKEVLDGDSTVTNSRKHVILVSDGATYLFCKDSTTISGGYDYTSALTRVADYRMRNGEFNHSEDGTISEWNLKYATSEEAKLIADRKLSYAQWTPSNWNDYFTEIANAKDYSSYNVDYFKASKEGTLQSNYLPLEKNASGTGYSSVINVDESLYQANKIYQQMKTEGYDCNAYTTGSNVAPVFTSFMNYLAGGTAKKLTEINNDIFYLLSAGSSIYDEMGKDADHEFNFVNDITKLTLTVDGESYTATAGTTQSGATATYLFNHAGVTALNGGAAPYVLNYYDGTNGTAEHIEWQINENVSEFARVQLTYSEKLANPKTDAGNYTVTTNNKAQLNPVDSNGTARASELFESPKVTYTILPKTPTNPEPTDDNKQTNTDRPITPSTTTNTKTTTGTTNARPSTPSTGDETNSLFYAGMFTVSAAGIFLILVLKRKYFEA